MQRVKSVVKKASPPSLTSWLPRSLFLSAGVLYNTCTLPEYATERGKCVKNYECTPRQRKYTYNIAVLLLGKHLLENSIATKRLSVTFLVQRLISQANNNVKRPHLFRYSQQKNAEFSYCIVSDPDPRVLMIWGHRVHGFNDAMWPHSYQAEKRGAH